MNVFENIRDKLYELGIAAFTGLQTNGPVLVFRRPNGSFNNLLNKIKAFLLALFCCICHFHIVSHFVA